MHGKIGPQLVIHCQCHGLDHGLYLSGMEDLDDDFFLIIRTYQKGFWQRLKTAISILFKGEKDLQEVCINKKDLEAIHVFIGDNLTLWKTKKNN